MQNGAKLVQRWCKAGAHVVQGKCRDCAKNGAELVQRLCKANIMIGQILHRWCKIGAKLKRLGLRLRECNIDVLSFLLTELQSRS